jgi:hypothetical protein
MSKANDEKMAGRGASNILPLLVRFVGRALLYTTIKPQKIQFRMKNRLFSAVLLRKIRFLKEK